MPSKRSSRKPARKSTTVGWRTHAMPSSHVLPPTYRQERSYNIPPAYPRTPEGFQEIEHDYAPAPESSIAEIFDTFSPTDTVTIADTGGSSYALDEDEEYENFGPGSEGFEQPDLSDEEWIDGATDMIDDDVIDRRAHTHYSREEVAEYIDQLAEGMDCDISDLYDMYYGYTDAA